MACVDYDGTLTTGVSETACTNTHGACFYRDETELPVFDPLCTDCNRDECTGSVCETEYHFAAARQVDIQYNLTKTTTRKGLCYIMLNQYEDSKTCSYVGGGYPGVVTSWSTLHNAICLAYDYLDAASCTNAGATDGSFRPNFFLPNGFSGCDNKTWAVCEIDFFSPLWVGGDKWSSNKSSVDCNECAGNQTSYFRRFSRYWRPGSIRQAQWVTPTLLPYTAPIATLDYLTLGSDVTNAIQTYYQYQERTGATCRISAPTTLTENALCQCSYYNTDDVTNSTCNPLSETSLTVLSGVSLICTGFTNTLSSYPATFNFPSNSVSIDGECVTVESRFRSLLYYHTDEVPPLSSIFWFDPITPDTLVAKNENGAEVGVIVSQGTTIDTSGDSGASLTNVQLCITRTSSILETPTRSYDPSVFTIPDIGIATNGSAVVIPIGATMSVYSNATYCTTLSTLEPVTYFLVFRMTGLDDWNTTKVSYLDRGEQVYIGVIGCLYVIVFFWSLFAIYWNWDKVLWMMYISIAIFMVWRAVHLLIISGSNAAIQSPALSEPPIFFYFSTITILAVMYHVIRTNQDISKHRPAMLRLNVIINSILIAILLVVIFVSEFVDSSIVRETSCYGRVDLGVPQWPAQRIIALVYLCVLCSMSIVFGLAILISGYLLQDELNKGAKNKVSREEKTSNKYFGLALLLSLSVMCLCSQLLLFGNIQSTRTIIWLRLTLLWIFELPSIVALLTYSTIQARKSVKSDTTSTAVTSRTKG